MCLGNGMGYIHVSALVTLHRLHPSHQMKRSRVLYATVNRGDRSLSFIPDLSDPTRKATNPAGRFLSCSTP